MSIEVSEACGWASAQEFFAMELALVRKEIEHMRRQIHRQRKDIQALQRAGICTGSAEELLGRMLAKVDELAAERDRQVGQCRIAKRA